MRPSRRLLSSLSLSAILSFCFAPARAFAQAAPGTGAAAALGATQAVPLPKEWDDAVATLAKKIKDAMGASRTLALEFQNISSISEADAGAIRIRLAADLTRHDLRLLPESEVKADETPTTVRVTLSENPSERIWVGEIEQGGQTQVVMVRVDKEVNLNSGLIPAPVLQKRIIFRQDGPILDFDVTELFPNSSLKMDVREILTPQGVVRYQFQGNKIQTALQNSQPQNLLLDMDPNRTTVRGSRDLRGRLVHDAKGGIRYFIGGVVCAATPGLYCGENSEQGWPIAPIEQGWTAQYDSGRNYFKAGGLWDGEIMEKLPDFYSVGKFDYDHGSLLVLTELDGKARAYDGLNLSATYSGWGDDIVSLGQGCDYHFQALVTGTGDWTQPDYLQLYELDRDHATPLGQPLEFSGPITALWPSDDGKSAHVVSRDLATGEYEASIVTVVCNN